MSKDTGCAALLSENLKCLSLSSPLLFLQPLTFLSSLTLFLFTSTYYFSLQAGTPELFAQIQPFSLRGNVWEGKNIQIRTILVLSVQKYVCV